jgi:hypothetical protein
MRTARAPQQIERGDRAAAGGEHRSSSARSWHPARPGASNSTGGDRRHPKCAAPDVPTRAWTNRAPSSMPRPAAQARRRRPGRCGAGRRGIGGLSSRPWRILHRPAASSTLMRVAARRKLATCACRAARPAHLHERVSDGWTGTAHYITIGSRREGTRRSRSASDPPPA